jgi:hypothetical protein
MNLFDVKSESPPSPIASGSGGRGDPVASGSGDGGTVKRRSQIMRVVDCGSHFVGSTFGRLGTKGHSSIGRMGGAITSGSGGGHIASGSGRGVKRKKESVKRESVEDTEVLATAEGSGTRSGSRRGRKAAARADSQVRDPDWAEQTGTPPSENSN